MEAGIESASPIQIHIEPVEKTVCVSSIIDNLKVNGSLLLDLCQQCINLSKIAQYTHIRSEKLLVANLFRTIRSHIQIIHSSLATYNEIHNSTFSAGMEEITYGLYTRKSIQQYVSLLWEKLKFPYSQQVRSLLLKVLLEIENISNLFQFQSLQPSSPKRFTYKEPYKTSRPSFEYQVINPAPSSLVIDPLITSLQRNYYYPLTFEMATDEMEYDSNEVSNQTTTSPQKASNKNVETSIDTISDFLQEMEGEDPPTQSEFTSANVLAKQTVSQVKASFHKHRFSIYRKIYTNAGQSSNSQISLFKSFSKCLKKLDPQAQILPLRNDRQVHPLTTTDQINNITEVGLLNFFKPYKRSQRSYHYREISTLVPP